MNEILKIFVKKDTKTLRNFLVHVERKKPETFNPQVC